MPLTAENIWVPESTKGAETMSAADMMTLAAALGVCTKYQIGLLCPRCDQSFHGKNGTTDKTWIIECACRQIRADMGSGTA